MFYTFEHFLVSKAIILHLNVTTEVLKYSTIIQCSDMSTFRALKRELDEAEAKRNFIREKSRHVSQKIIEDRIQKHLIYMVLL